VSAKKRYPDRVFLVVGNRDLNKLRLVRELSDEAMAHEPPIPYGSPRTCTTFRAFLTKLAAQAGKVPEEAAELPPALWKELNTRPNRLRWILDCTMGAQGDFERRREEMAAISGAREVTDSQVVQSYLEMVRPGGVLAEFLRQGHLAVGIDETLFVHGGLIAKSFSKNGDKFVTDGPGSEGSYEGPPVEEGGFEVALGFIPGQAEREPDPRAWTSKLNAWYRNMIDQALSETPGPLLAVGQQYCSYGTWPSVIMGRHLNEKSQPVQLPPGVTQSLLVAGFTRLVIGHTPHGNCPTVVPGGVQTIMADTSYSDMKARDNRGDAASVLEIEGKRATVKGRLQDKEDIAYTVYSGEDARRTDAEGNNELIGKGDFGAWFVKAKLATKPQDDPMYLLCHVEGFKYEYQVKTEAQTRQLLGL